MGLRFNCWQTLRLPEDAHAAMEVGASGVGLFRSEFLFMGRTGVESALPSEEEQFQAYKAAVLQTMKGRPSRFVRLTLALINRLIAQITIFSIRPWDCGRFAIA